jgi:glycosyltransferase involved in cell wall biosynthesis
LADVNIYTLYATKGMDIPVIVSERNDPNNDPEKKWIRKLRDRVYRKADGFVFQTKDAKEYFDGKLPADSSSVIIPNPITSGLPYRNYKGGQKRLITASRLNAQKNLPMMIKAVGALREKGYDVILDIFGDGPDREVLEKYIGELNLSDTVLLRGFSKEVHKEMASSYAFLLSSDYEGISNSMLEALAIGLPVVVTDCPIGGARQFVRSGENGLLVPVRDTSAFTEAIEKVVSDEEYAALIGESAKDVRNVLQIDKITDLWIDFIIKTIKGV